MTCIGGNIMMGKKRLFKKWLFTYLVLIIFSLVFILGIYMIYNRTMKDDLKTLNDLYLEQVVNLIEGELDALDQLVYNIGIEPGFINVTNFERNLTTTNRYDIRTMHNNLNLFARATSFVKQIDLYAQKPDMVISNNSAYYGEYIDLYTEKNFGISSILYKELLMKTYRQKVIRLKDWYTEAEGENVLLYIQTLPIQFQNNPQGALVLTIEEKSLHNIGMNKVVSNNKMMIFNESQQLVYTNEPNAYASNDNHDEVISTQADEIYIANESYIKSTIKTERQWVYISLVPKSSYFERVNNIGRVTLMVTILFILLNTLLAYYFAMRMYLPVKKIMISFKDEDYEINQSEYAYIEEHINKKNKEQALLKKDLMSQTQSLKNAFFSKLFRGYIKEPIFIQQQLEKYQMRITESGYQIILIDFTMPIDKAYEQQLSRFVIQNVFHEVLSSYFTCEAVEIEDRVAFIIGVKYEEGSHDVIENQVATAIEMIDKNFGMTCCCGISQIHRHILGLTDAYQESLEAIKNACVLDGCNIIYYEAIQNLNSLYVYNTEDEYKLIHYIKIGDLEAAVLLIESIVDFNREENQIKLGYMQCLMFDLVGSVMKAVNDEAFGELLGKKGSIKRMMQTDRIEDMKNIIFEMLTMACEINSTHQLARRESTIVKDIDQYIEAHYADSELNVSKLGDVFHMTPAHLSKLYKKEADMAISTAINQVRVKAAEKFLINTNDNVSCIAEKVGYLYPNAFIRFFKSHTGLTPGQFRQLNKVD